MRAFNILFLLVWAAVFLPVRATFAQVDQRRTPITAQQLKARLGSIPLSSEEHGVLIARTGGTDASRIAYETYTRIWKAKSDFHANLWRGVAAKVYAEHVLSPFDKNGPRTFNKQQLALSNTLWKVAGSSLKQAVTLDERSGLAHAEYGYFLFYRDSKIEAGVKHLEKGVLLAPKNPRTHRLLAGVYSNRATKFYNPNKAEDGYRVALKLDPNYAAARWGRMYLYESMKRYKDALDELSAYKSLVPPEVSQSYVVSMTESRLKRSL